jgi:hypothetical protein
MRKAAADLAEETPGRPTAGFSYGLEECELPCERSMEDMIRSADERMYVDKQNRRLDSPENEE